MSDFKPMLAKDGDLTKVKFPQMAQPKLDGIRASVVDGKLLSRTLKLIPNASIQAVLGRAEFNGLDGELIVGEPTDADCYRNTTSFVMSESKTGFNWTYYVFDKWDHAGPFRQRFADLEDDMGWLAASAPIKLVETVVVNDLLGVEAVEAACLGQGLEGVILRDPNALYKFGRSGKTGPLLKIKRFSDSEAVILGSEEEMHNANVATTNALGRTERSSHKAGKVGKNSLGKLLVKDRYSGVEFSVGTGFTAQERADLWANRDSLPGRVIRYKFFAIGVKDKPRHPVMQGFRADVDLPEAE